ESPGDKSILDRCEGPTLDIGSGPGRLTVALAERGIPALGIDITPYAVDLAALLRRVAELLAPQGRAIVELEPPGSLLRRENVRLCHGGSASAWFPWAYVGA